MANIIILEDQQLVLESFRFLIESKSNHKVIGKFTNTQDALDFIKQDPQKADVAIVDVKLAGENGFQFISQVSESPGLNLKCILLTQYLNTSLIKQGFEVGALAYLVKSATETELFDAINTVMDGKVYYCNAVSKLLANDRQFDQGRDVLSNKEIQVLNILGKGYSQEKIAETLSVEISTIRFHIKNIKSKLQIETMAQLINHAIENGYSI